MINDPFRTFFKHGNLRMRENLAKQDSVLASELTALWVSAYEKIYGFEAGKRQQGPPHNLAVENNIGFLLKHFKLFDKMKPKDIFVLSAAAALHDMDKAMNKDNQVYAHGRNGKKLLLKESIHREFNLDARKAEAVAWLIDVHDDGDFNRLPEDAFVIDDPPGLNLRGLAAIFRLSDILHTTYERYPDVIAEIRSAKTKDEEKTAQATRLIGGWTISADNKTIILQVIRPHESEDELALLAMVDYLNDQITVSHRKYLDHCPIISPDENVVVVTLPSKIELEKTNLEYRYAGLRELQDEILVCYLQKLHGALEYVDLGGLGFFKEKAKTPLSEIFIDLRCKRSSRYGSLPLDLRNYDPTCKSTGDNRSEIINRLIAYAEVQVSDLSITEGIRYLVLLGHAGAGKSTVTQYLTICLSDPERRVSNPLPFRIPVRFFISERTKRNGNYSFIDFILDEIDVRISPMKCPKSLVEYFLREKKSILILDGFDEVTKSEERKTVCTCISDFIKNFEKARLIVTSRIYGYEEAPLSWAGFLHVESVPLSNQRLKTL